MTRSQLTRSIMTAKPILHYLKWLLLPLGILHLGIVWLRNRLYDAGIFKTRRLPRPVISVGNIQMGGSGKTPLALELLEWLQGEGLRVGVLSRGYKRGSRENRILLPGGESGLAAQIGDEPALIFKKLRAGALGVGADRYEVGRELLRRQEVEVFLLDDGFQHRRLHRELDICLIDVSRWAEHPFLFPFSYLRDAKVSLRRAGAILLTKFEKCPEKAETLKSRLKKAYPVPVLKTGLIFHTLTRLGDGEPLDPGEIKSQPVAAVCGIANPEHFFALLEREGFRIAYRKAFPDHHDYTLQEMIGIEKAAAQAGARGVLATEKDAVKLRAHLPKMPELNEKVWVFGVRVRVAEAERLRELLKSIIQR